MNLIDRPSPNQDARGGVPVDMLILHYTGMTSGEAALARLCDPAAKVSAHYAIDENGTVTAMVPEAQRAWHAGVSFWAGARDINTRSIGIELVNPGHEFGYRPFPDAQIGALTVLCRQILARHSISPWRVLGHSDVAPARKDDPGELFDWERLARFRLALPRPTKYLTDPLWSDASFLLALERFGYDVVDGEAAVRAFQRRFRPSLIDGVIDGQCRAILLSLLTGGDKGAETRRGRSG